MSTVISVEQGGTGVQTVPKLKEILGLKAASQLATSNDPTSNSYETVPTSYALSKAMEKIGDGIPDVLPIERGGTGATSVQELITNLGLNQDKTEYPISIEKGGTGATNAADAIRNLGIENQTIQYPISVSHGGTGAEDAEQARMNLGITFPLSVEQGGTGVNSLDELKDLVGSTSGGITLPLSVEEGGTGATNPIQARENLGIVFPIPIEQGGTGATYKDQIINNIFDSENSKIPLDKLNIEFPLAEEFGGTGTNSIQNFLAQLTSSISVLRLEQIDLNYIIKNGYYYVESADKNNIRNCPTNDENDFVLMVFNGIIGEEPKENPSNDGNLYQISGHVLQLLLCFPRLETEKSYSRVYVRSFFNNGKTPEQNELEGNKIFGWGKWVRIDNGEYPVNDTQETNKNLWTALKIKSEISKSTDERITISASAPSGGKNGDIWYQYI